MRIAKLLIAAVACCLITTGHAQDGKHFTNKEGIAIQGYDLVSYFNQHEAVRGSKANAVQNDGVTFYFSSSRNMEAFQANPAQYLPQYGGYCAFAMAAKNAKVPSDPRTFKINDGKLYLFFNDYYEGSPFNTIVPWNASEAGMRTKADTNWKAMN